MTKTEKRYAADAEAKTGHGGARPGAGRPSAGADKMAPTTIRLTAAQRDKLARLGGADFIRRAIDQAREP